MSRTYRRKNAEWDMWAYHKPRRHVYAHRAYEIIPVDSIKGRIARAVFHSDASMSMKMVPKWYKVEFLRRPFRTKSKAALNRAIAAGEDLVIPIDKKAAMYYW